ncbi:PHD-finger, partial [Opisthorchis viverrini]
MLYFEDFMEGCLFLSLYTNGLAIENLPGELTESLTTVRQLDLLTQSILEPLAEANRTYFEDCKYNRLSDYQQNIRYSEIVREYEKALSNCREKRQIVEKIYNTYEKLVRKLDTELEKFRLELEADNSGITEQIEQRITAMLGKPQNPTVKPERRRQRFRYQSTSHHFKNPFLMRRKIIGQACRTALKSSTVRQVFPHKGENSHIGRPGAQKAFRAKISVPHRIPKPTTIGSKSNEDNGFARRSRPVDFANDPSLFNPEGGLEPRPYPSMSSNTKSSLEIEEEESAGFANDITSLTSRNSPLFSLPAHSEFGPGILEKGGLSASAVRSQRVGSTGASSDVSDSPSTTSRSNSTVLVDHRLVGVPSPIGWHGVSGNRDRRSRGSRRPGREALMDELGSDTLHSTDFDEPHSNAPSTTTDGFFESSSFGFVSDVKLDNPEEGLEDDEDQKRYCVCNDVSYGDMIACDNPNCPFEWFHYSCVSLTVAPKGDWYCPSCIKTFSSTKSMKKRIGRRQ